MDNTSMDMTVILLLVAGFYMGLLTAKSGLTFEKAISPFTGLCKLIGNAINKLDKNKEDKDAEEKDTDEKRKRTRRRL